MAGTTPSQGIPYAERPDPFELTADLRGSFNKIDSVFAQTRGESTAALTAAQVAEVKAAQALLRALAIEDPVHVGPEAPTDGEALWVDTDAEPTHAPVGDVTAADIVDASEVGRNVLTASLSVDARNALSIFTGTRALLDAGTDTAERTWDAKELAEYVTSKASGGGSVASVDPYAANTARQTLMVQAMGGIVDTGGLGAVAIRIDHGWKNFKEKLLPIFRAANIVPMVTYNPRDWERTENEGVTTAEVNQWVADGWVEISNHGAVHQNASGAAEIDDFVGGSLAEIETQLPAAAGKVFGFCVPGVSSVEFPYDGFVNGGTAAMWDTTMGKTILRYHAVGYGYMPGTHLRVLDGTIRQGQNHVTLDAGNVTSAKSYIDQAATQRRGLQLMLHPSLVDTAGKITTAQVQEVVDYIVAKRTAGDLLTLTSYQMMVADSSRVATSGAVELRDTDWQAFIPAGGAVDPLEPGVVELRRIEDQVFCRIVGVAILPGASNDWLMPNGLPVGYRLGAVGMVVDVPGGYATSAQSNRAVRHRLAVLENDIAYVGYIHNWSGVTVEAARDDGTRRIYGNVPSWVTDDPFPT